MTAPDNPSPTLVQLSPTDEMTIEAVVWRRHSNGVGAAEIAAEINQHYGNGTDIVALATVAAWVARHESLRRSDPTTKIDAFRRIGSGLRVLRGELSIALSNFNAAHHEAGRAGAFIALQSVCDFIEGYVDEAPGELSLPLRTLMLALEQADTGGTHPIVAPAPRPRGGPKIDFSRDTLASFGAIAMDAAMDGGMDRKAAAAAVARELRRLGYRKPNGRPIEPATVMAWRDRAGEGAGGLYPEAARRLREFRQIAERFRGAGGQIKPNTWKALLSPLPKRDRMAGIRRNS